jgi:hypothetical protein
MSFLSRLFKFRIFKFRTTLSEELDDLHCELVDLQQNLIQTRLLQRKWTKQFAIYAILIYLAVNISYYTLFLSHDFVNRIYAFTISIALAVLLYGIHWTLRWYFRATIQMKEEKIVLFKERKQELIEEVKTKETYTVAKNLLEKYGETITPEVRSPVINGNSKGILYARKRASNRFFSSNHKKPIIFPIISLNFLTLIDLVHNILTDIL